MERDALAPGPAGPPPLPLRGLTLPPQGWQQQPVPVQADWFRVGFRVVSGGGPLGTYCQGVTVDDTSNDGTVATARHVTLSDREPKPELASGPGAESG